MLKSIYGVILSLALISCSSSSPVIPKIDSGAVDHQAGHEKGSDQAGGGCSGGLSKCGAVCTDVTSDPNNCGGCGMACPAGAGCTHGICGSCPPDGTTLCNGQCVNLQTDPN